MVPLAVRCGCAIGTLTARTRSSRIFKVWLMFVSEQIWRPTAARMRCLLDEMPAFDR